MAGKMNLQTIECRCGARRIRGDSCGDCGFKPPPGAAIEINAFTTSRRQIVRRVDELVEENLEGLSDTPLYEEIVDTFPEQFRSALESLIANGASLADAQLMAEPLARLERARCGLLPMENLRPYGEERAQLAVLDKMSTWWPIYRDALTANDPKVIRAQTAQGQRAIDLSGQAKIDIDPTLQAMTVLGDYESQPSLVKRQICALELKHPGVPLSELAEVGAEHATRTMGFQCPPLMGLEYQMLRMLAESEFLPEKFEGKIRETARLWHGNLERVQEVAGMDRAVEDLADFSARFTEAFLRFDQGIQVASHNRGVIRAAEKLLGSIYEDAQPLWTWNALLLGNSVAKGKYEKAAKENSTSHVAKVKRALPVVAADAEAFYRNAAQHGTSLRPEPDGEHVLISTNSGNRRLTAAEFIDKVYALIESVLAMHWVARVFLNASDKFLPERDDMPLGFGLTTRDEAFFFLEVQQGVRLHHDRIVNGIWYVEAEVPVTDTLHTAVLLALRSDPEVDVVELTRPDHIGQLLHISGKYVQELRTEKEDVSVTATEDEVLIRRLKIRAAASIGDKPILSHADLKYGVAGFGLRLLEDVTPLQTQMPRLRAVRTWAGEQGFTDVIEMFKFVLATDRSGDSTKKRLACRKLREYAVSAPQPEFPLPTGVRVQTA